MLTQPAIAEVYAEFTSNVFLHWRRGYVNYFVKVYKQTQQIILAQGLLANGRVQEKH